MCSQGVGRGWGGGRDGGRGGRGGGGGGGGGWGGVRRRSADMDLLSGVS